MSTDTSSSTSSTSDSNVIDAVQRLQAMRRTTPMPLTSRHDKAISWHEKRATRWFGISYAFLLPAMVLTVWGGMDMFFREFRQGVTLSVLAALCAIGFLACWGMSAWHELQSDNHREAQLADGE